MSDPAAIRDILDFLRDYVGLVVASPEDDIFASGQVDSMRVVEIVMFLEERFRVTLPQDRLTLDQLSTVARMAALVERSRIP